MSRVLVVDDEQGMRNMLAIALKQDGHDVVTAADGEAAHAELEGRGVDLVVSDIRMPGLDGIQLLRRVKETAPEIEVILVTAHASTDSAVEALRLGAYDYITKPFDVEELKVTVRNALERQALRQENTYLRHELTERHRVDELVGRSPAMRRVFDLIERVADSDITVLITGESGTGKELVARAIHNSGARGDKPFVTVNCAALPAQLLESELFGHKRGSFTGADRDKEGLFVAAEGGTLLLDEIGEMPLEMQPKLLRVLEDHRVRPVGSTQEVPTDVRVLASTNRQLPSAVSSAEFRQDLFYRLNVIQVEVPPLRERPEDIPVLAEHFLEKFTVKGNRAVSGFSLEAKRLLEAYDWPGNVRELENAVRRGVTLERTATIQPDSLPDTLRRGPGAVPDGVLGTAQRPPEAETPPDAGALPDGGIDLEQHLDEVKRAYMLAALERAGGVQKKAAELLGMSFRSFRYYLDKLDLRDRDGSGEAAG